MKWYRLVELLRGLEHLLVHLPRRLRGAEDELLDLLELVNTENAPGILKHQGL